MKRFLKTLFGSRWERESADQLRVRPTLTCLEDRTVPSLTAPSGALTPAGPTLAVPAGPPTAPNSALPNPGPTAPGGPLTRENVIVHGSDFDDRITISMENGLIKIHGQLWSFSKYYDPATTGNIIVYGNLGNDTITNDTGFRAVMYGGEGNDTLIGGTGSDLLYGDIGSDSLDGRGGNDQLDGGGDADTLVGGTGNDSIRGGDGNDTLFGGNIDGSDTGPDADTLDGGAGYDSLVADYDDTLTGEHFYLD